MKPFHFFEIIRIWVVGVFAPVKFPKCRGVKSFINFPVLLSFYSFKKGDYFFKSVALQFRRNFKSQIRNLVNRHRSLDVEIIDKVFKKKNNQFHDIFFADTFFHFLNRRRCSAVENHFKFWLPVFDNFTF